MYAIAPLFVTGLGLYGIVFGGFQIFNTILLVVGVLLIIASLFDFPLYTTFGPDGIERRCLGRRDHVPWMRVQAVARPARGGVTGRVRSGLGISNSTGLVAELGPRPSMLVDRIESPAEFEAIERGMAVWIPGMIIRASKPPDGTAPTWMHKRRIGEGDGLVDLV